MVQEIVDAIVAFVKEHENFAAPIAFLVAFAESFAFLSLIWPGTAILVGISALLAASGADTAILWPSILAATLGGTLGYWFSYWIGQRFKDNIAGIWPFSSHPDLIPHGKHFFEKYGAWGVFLGHFFGPVRAVIPVVAGMFEMRILTFQIANIISAFIWAAGVIAPAFFLVTFHQEVLAFIRDHQTLTVAAMFLIGFLNSLPMPLLAVPTLILFVALGAIDIYAGGDPVLILAMGALGAFAGDVFGYVSGRRWPEDFQNIWPNSWSPQSADNARAYTERYGTIGLLFSKFHTTLRAFAPAALGAARTPPLAFLVVSAVSAAVWSAVLLSPRYIVGAVTGV